MRKIREINRADVPQLLLIEEAAHVVPWTEEVFKMCFQPHYKGWVIEENNIVTGFIMTSIMEAECHILNLCVSLSAQRKGMGHALLQHVIEFAQTLPVDFIFLEVRRSNTRAISLYQKAGLRPIGVRKNYYPTIVGQEDALIYAMTLPKNNSLK